MEPTDIELMLRVRDGDVAAFGELLRRYRAPLRRFFASLLPDPSQADDVVQEVFLRLWLSRQRYEPTGRVSTYLFQIGRHYWLNQRKKFRRELGEDVLDQALQTRPLGTPQPETLLLQEHRALRIRRAIAALPERYRTVFELSHVEGLKYAEIGERLGIPVGTVKSRMAEAVRRLRQALAGEEEGDGGR
jgi:RNA polymerase sigma-70 factor, ECF subfamily